jgi:hypothetical protein
LQTADIGKYLPPRIAFALSISPYLKCKLKYFPFVERKKCKGYLEPGSPKIQEHYLAPHTVPVVYKGYTPAHMVPHTVPVVCRAYAPAHGGIFRHDGAM